MDYKDGMQMIGHNDVVQNLYHRVVGRNACCQFLFHHTTNGRQFHMWCIRMAIRLTDIASHRT